MLIAHRTPIVADEVRLFYRSSYTIQRGKVGGAFKGPLFIPPKGNTGKGLFRLLDPENVIAQIRLYRWFYKRYEEKKQEGSEDFSNFILKDALMNLLFSDAPNINKIRVGKLLRMVVRYDVNFQKSRDKNHDHPSLMLWRWSHYLDIAYGLEHLMALWVPRVANATGGKCYTQQEYLEELEVIRGASQKEDLEYVNEIISADLY